MIAQVNLGEVVFHERDVSVFWQEGSADDKRKSKATLVVHGRTLWTGTCDSPPDVGYSPEIGRILISSRGDGMWVLSEKGGIVRHIPYCAARDPRPLLFGKDYVVLGRGIYNWTSFDRENFSWHEGVRQFDAINLRKNQLVHLPSFGQVGLPVAIVGGKCLCIKPENWSRLLHTVSSKHFDYLRTVPTHFEFVMVDLSGSRSQIRKFTVKATEGLELFGQIVGFDPVTVTLNVGTKKLTFESGPAGAFAIPVPSRLLH